MWVSFLGTLCACANPFQCFVVVALTPLKSACWSATAPFQRDKWSILSFIYSTPVGFLSTIKGTTEKIFRVPGWNSIFHTFLWCHFSIEPLKADGDVTWMYSFCRCFVLQINFPVLGYARASRGQSSAGGPGFKATLPPLQYEWNMWSCEHREPTDVASHGSQWSHNMLQRLQQKNTAVSERFTNLWRAFLDI